MRNTLVNIIFIILENERKINFKITSLIDEPRIRKSVKKGKMKKIEHLIHFNHKIF